MRVTEGLREAFDTVRHNKLRTALTILSIVIGVASVIAVMAIGIMGRRAIMGDLAALGGALYWIEPQEEEWWDDGRRDQHLRLEHLDAIAALVSDTSWVSPVLRGEAKLRFRDREATASLFGVGPEYAELWPLSVQAGRFLEAPEVRQRHKVIVLGDRIAHRLFDDPERAVGSVVSAGGLQLQVVGVMAADFRAAGDGSDDRTSYLPHQLYRGIYRWDDAVGPHVPEITLRARDSARLGESMALVQRFLDRVLPGSPSVRPFVVETDQARLETEANVLRVMSTVVTLVAGISLLVGGLGIMNIMLVSVSERTVEIGLRKAVGARDGDILGQFLIESVVICLLGGLCGVVLGFGGTLAVALALGWNLILPEVAAVGLGVAVATGLFFGVYPAAKAARLPPVVALSRN